MDGLPTMTTQTFVGILVAITGNVLISLALNLQKVAHKRVESLRKLDNGIRRGHSVNNGYNDISESQVSEGPSLDEQDEDRELLEVRRTQLDVFSDPSSDIQLLTAFPESEANLQHYGTNSNRGHSTVTKPLKTKRSNASRRLLSRSFSKKAVPGRHIPPDDNMLEEQGLLPTHKGLDDESEAEHQNPKEGNYLKSKIWSTTKICQFDSWLIIHTRWLGFLLMNIGETGNFISYAFAPASVVAPLGTVSRIHQSCTYVTILNPEF
jgi:magnesium transporter